MKWISFFVLSWTFSSLVQAASLTISDESWKKVELAVEKANSHAGAGRKISVFEVDQVLLEGSFQDSFLYWMLKNNKILKPTNWSFASKWLTEASIDILDSRCSLNSTSSLTLMTDLYPLCAQTIWWIYSQSQIPGHGDLNVWKRSDPESTLKFRMAWAAQLQAGYTAKEVRDFARLALKEAKKLSLNKTYKVGEAIVFPAVRVAPAMFSLIRKLESKGVEVWLTGAMSQPLIEVVAEDLKIIKDRSVGLQAREDNKKRLLARFENCSSERDPVMNLMMGRRCWIQKKIFLEKSRNRMMDTPAPIDLYFGPSGSDDVLYKDARYLRAQIDLNNASFRID